ncbi:disease resistance protein RGA2-like [Nicotiana tabacum]|uniref:Disease resistance RPP13-like protein 1 n=1 Tax=Nicotiana tabacum TaxID=4097 RepID=A0A1S3Y014_TOBAC|nr:PREDICTED: putative disease resistance RPP13-like protein 1 [Nicotiana tabacum]
MGFKEEVRSGFIAGAALILFEGIAKFAVSEIGKLWNVDAELRRLERCVSKVMAMIEWVEDGHCNCFSSERSKKAWELWLEDIKTLACFADDLLDEISLELDHHNRVKVAANASSSQEEHPLRKKILSSGKLNVPRQISKLREKLEDLAGEMDKLLSFESHKSEKTTEVVTSSSSTSFVGKSLIVGREIQKAEIVEKLLCDIYMPRHKLSIIPIVGMGGIGKTALARLVYNDEQVIKSFYLRMWVSVSMDFDVVRVTKSIIESATKTSCTLMDLDPLQVTLQKLLCGRRFLLVLDDLWSEKDSDWEILSAPLRFGYNGSKVIITTRSRRVSNVVGSDPYLLHFLHDMDCWNIIRQRAILNNIIGAGENVDAIGLEIAKKCKGLPLAANVLASTMSCLPYEEWDAILKSDLWDLTQCRDAIFPSLAIRYRCLPAELKKCFAYCALFPASYKFEEDNLVLMWLAEGLIQPMGEITLECIGKQYFKDLAGRSFFYLEKKKIYKMHDFFREMAQFISTDICLQIEDENPTCSPSLGSIRHLSLCCNNLVSVKSMEEFPKCERLRTFLLTCRNVDAGVGEATTYLLQKFSLLRVLDLSHGHIVELPDTIDNLMYLRYLNLSGNLLRRIPESIGTLFYLQTLQLNSCKELCYLPASLRNLGNLRHLQFDKCWRIENMPSKFVELTNLQTLSTFVVSEAEGYTIVELKKMTFLKGSLHLFGFENVKDETQVLEANLHMMSLLNELELEWVVRRVGHDTLVVLGHVKFHENLEKLVITGYYGCEFPQRWLIDSGFNLKSIHLKGCDDCPSLPVLGHLQLLESLCIEDMPLVREAQAGFFQGFPSLKSLKFWNMLTLTRLVDLISGDVPSLRVLICKNCPSLRSLPSLDILGSLTILKIKKCPAVGKLPERMPISLRKIDVRGSEIVAARCQVDQEDWIKTRGIPGLTIRTTDE